MEYTPNDNIFKVESVEKKTGKFKVKTLILQKTEKCFFDLGIISPICKVFLYKEHRLQSLN